MKVQCRVPVSAMVAVALVLPAGAQAVFTHDAGSVGRNPSAVFSAPDVQDVFATAFANTNTLQVNNPASLGLMAGDNIDALHDSGTLQLGGSSGDVIVPFTFSVRPGAQGLPGTPINASAPFNAADLFRVVTGGGHVLFQNDSALGMAMSNVAESVDGLSLEPLMNFQTGDRIYFSLTPGSPTLTTNGWSPASILTAVVGSPASLREAISPSTIGLLPGDNLDALILYDVFDSNGDGRLDGLQDRATIFFSVQDGSIGLVGTDVRAEASLNGAANDIFMSGRADTNALVLDGTDYMKMDPDDDLDALDLPHNTGGFGDPFLAPLTPISPPTQTVPPPPPYDDMCRCPIGILYFLVCNGSVGAGTLIKSQINVTVCSPSGQRHFIMHKPKAPQRLTGTIDGCKKAHEMAPQLEAVSMKDIENNVLKAGPDGTPLKVFEDVKVLKGADMTIKGSHVAQICVKVNQDIIDCGWAVDEVSFCFSNFTGGTVVVPVEKPGSLSAGAFNEQTISIAAPASAAGTLALTYSDMHPVSPQLQTFSAPFSAGASGHSILAAMRDVINASGGQAGLTSEGLVVRALPLEALPGTGFQGPILLDGGAVSNDLGVEVKAEARACLVDCAAPRSVAPQAVRNRSDIRPQAARSVSGRVRDAGTYHTATGRWTRNRASPEGLLTTVYNNTCFWTGTSPNSMTFAGVDDCQDIYDEGRVPATGPVGATPDNLISAVTFGHVTFAPTGSVDVELTFYDSLGGPCVGGVSPTPPEPPFAGQIRLSTAYGVTLPGDPTGSGTAWVVTLDLSGGGEFCLLSDGDGTTGTGSDLFTWRYRHYNPRLWFGGASGPLVAGELLKGVFGTCTYGMTGAQACGTDPMGVGPCGTGLGAGDSFWRNVDGDFADGTQANSSCYCTLGDGTGCFFFGGWPGNPWSSYFLALHSAGECPGAPPPTFFCTGKTTTTGCVPFLTATGTASTTSTAAFSIRGNDHVTLESGALIYSFKKANLNFHGGKLCVKAPAVRTGAKAAKTAVCVNPIGSCQSTTCGLLSRNFNATIQSGSDPLLTPGQAVNAQWRQRDPLNSFGDNLSDGVNFIISP